MSQGLLDANADEEATVTADWLFQRSRPLMLLGHSLGG